MDITLYFVEMKRVLVVYFDSYTKLSTKTGGHVHCSLSDSLCQSLDGDVCSPFLSVCFLVVPFKLSRESCVVLSLSKIIDI